MATSIDARFQADERFGEWTVFDTKDKLHVIHEKPWNQGMAQWVAEQMNKTRRTAAWSWANDREEVVR